MHACMQSREAVLVHAVNPPMHMDGCAHTPCRCNSKVGTAPQSALKGYMIAQNATEMKQALMQYGAITVEVTTPGWQAYKGEG